MSCLARRARSLPLRQLAALRPAAAAGVDVCAQLLPPLPPPIGSLPAGKPASLLWRYDSPLLRHLSTTAPETTAEADKGPEASAAAAAAAAGSIPELPPYQELEARAAAAADGTPLLVLAPGERSHFDRLLRSFQLSGAVKDQALALYVNSKLYAKAVPRFQEWLLAAMGAPLRDALLRLKPGQESAQQALFPYFAEWVLERHHTEIKAYRDMIQTVDLRNPHQWFPMARALQRRIIYHAGPTNSGKTYNALQAMRGAKSGAYCGPLRLLAMEVYDTCNADGLYCNLITGQERREVPGAEHTACTVEMVNMARRVDVAVLDEIQMIGDDSRGWAWTRALMGVPANEVHLCGDGSAVPLVRKICEEMGDSFELNEYDRFTTLSVEEGGLEGGYAAVQPGDCVVAFSRRDIYAIKQFIEQETKHRACVVYGALPPETRRQQAKLFNEPDNAYRVMVASDAVGMGLNLNIRRIIFHAVTKREGGNKRHVPVSISMMKQIAGRAGRRSSQWPNGLATCLNPADVPRLQEALAVPLSQLTTPTAGLFPEFEHLEVFAGQRPDEPYSALLQAFQAEALLDTSYFFCRQDSVVAAAAMLDPLGLSVKDMFNFCMAPASASDLRLSAALLQFATKFSKGLPVTLDITVPSRVPASAEELRHMEAAHQVVMLWLWLSYRFDTEAFPEREKIQAQADSICHLLDKGLKRLTRMSKSGQDIADRPPRHEHESILECFSEELDLLEGQRRLARQQERKQERRAAASQRAEALLAAAVAGAEEGEGGEDAGPGAGRMRPRGREQPGEGQNSDLRRELQRRQRREQQDVAQLASGWQGVAPPPRNLAPGQHRHQKRQAEKQQTQQQRQAQQGEEVAGSFVRTPEQQQAQQERRVRQQEQRLQLQAQRKEERRRRHLERLAAAWEEGEPIVPPSRHLRKAHGKAALAGAEKRGPAAGGGAACGSSSSDAGWERLMSIAEGRPAPDAGGKAARAPAAPAPDAGSSPGSDAAEGGSRPTGWRRLLSLFK